MHRFICSSATLVALLTVSVTTSLIWNSLAAKTATVSDVPQSIGHHPTTHDSILDPILLASRLSRYGLRFRVSSSAFHRGGFRRGSSCLSDQEITGITPFEDENGDSLGDTAPSYFTASHHPTFFIHIPQLPPTNGILTIENRDEPLTERYFYQAEFEVSGESGIVGIRMPEDAPPLEEGNDYVWQVSVACKPGDIQDSLTVHGGVLRFTDLGAELGEASLETYLDAEVWQEALTMVAEERFGADTVDTELESDWAALMNSVGLSPFASEPIVQMINAN